MLNVFESMLSVFQMIGDYLWNIVSGIGSFLLMIPQAMGFVYNAMDTMPGTLQVYATVGMLICLVFMIIGR